MLKVEEKLQMRLYCYLKRLAAFPPLGGEENLQVQVYRCSKRRISLIKIGVKHGIGLIQRCPLCAVHSDEPVVVSH